jgi:hypothetical protein
MHPPTMAAAIVIRPPEAATRPHYQRVCIQQSADILFDRLLSLKLEKSIIINNY